MPPELQPEAALELVQKVLGIEREEVRHAPGAPRSRRSRSGGRAARRAQAAGSRTARTAGSARRRGPHGRAHARSWRRCRLRVGPADPADAGLLAQARARAVGSDQEMARARSPPPASATATRLVLGLEAAGRRPDEVDARARGRRRSAPPRARRSRPCGRRARRARPRRRRSGTPAAPGRRARLSVMTMSRIGCAPPSIAAPDAERLRASAGRRRRWRRRAVSPAGSRRERRIAHRHLERLAERLLQRQRQRQPGDAAAGDDDAPGGSVGGSFVRLIGHAPLCPRRAALSSGVTPLAYL